MTHPLRTLLLVVASLAALGLGGSAHAAPTRVLGLHVDGEKLSPKDRSDLFAVMQAKLRLYPDIELKNPPAGELTEEMMDLECVDLDAGCLARLGKKYDADKVVHVEVTSGNGKQRMHVRFVDVAQAKISRDKEVKADKVIELASALELEVEAVFGKPPAVVVVAQAPGTLVIDVDSPDAVIQLGTEYLGTGTATTELAPGDYTVRIMQEGFRDVIKKLSVKSGQTTSEHFRLVAIVGDIGPTKPKKPAEDDDQLDWVIWAIVGAVVVGGAVAVVALTAGGDNDVARGPAVLGIDGSSAWRDPATIGGRR